MEIELSYVPEQDRLRMSLQDQSDWYITRSLLLKLVGAWIEKLHGIDLPDVGISLGQRDIGQEHALSLEFDAPTTSHVPHVSTIEARLLQGVSLTVDAFGAKLLLNGQGIQTQMSLKRKESHLVLEMFAKKAKAVGWTDGVFWPKWLGDYS